MYKYKLMLEQEDSAKKAEKYQESRIMAFDQLEQKLENIKKALRQSKIETITYYRDNPKSYAVIKPTDIIGDYIKDIETLLNKN